MDLITLDFETAYGKGYSLTSLTYEEYIFDPRFQVFGVGIKINNGETTWHHGSAVRPALEKIFQKIDHEKESKSTLISTQSDDEKTTDLTSVSNEHKSNEIFAQEELAAAEEGEPKQQAATTSNAQTSRTSRTECSPTFTVGQKLQEGMPKCDPKTLTGAKLQLQQTDTTDPTLIDQPPPSSGWKVCLLGHNTMFDGAILSWYYNLKADMYLCTQAMSRAIWNHQSSSLEMLAKTCFPSNKKMRKGKELVLFKDLYELTEAQYEVLGGYCVNDVDLTRGCFDVMNQYFPNEELEIIDLTLKMFIHPPLMADLPRVTAYKERLENERKLLILNAKIPKTTLSSNQKFAEWILEQGIPFNKVPSPTEKNPDNMKWPLSKTDRPFIEIQAKYPEHAHVWAGRIAAKSPGELRRAERIERHAMLHDWHIAVPLNYCAAHTFRFGGTNKVNFQNFKRGSELRYSLMAPEGELVVVQDLSNIESRMLAWLAQEEKLLSDYRNKVDTYSVFASRIFQRHVDRKKIEIVDGEETYPDFTEGFVGKTCILGLGFQVAEEKLQNQLFAAKLVYSLGECKGFKDMYRTTYSKIPLLWHTAQQMIYHMTRRDAPPLKWGPMQVEFRRILMPNGLHLEYPGLRPIFEGASLRGYEYWNGKHWTNLYGGKLVENVIQCLSRILMTSAMLRIHKNLTRNEIGRVALTVHDEAVATVKEQYAEEVNEMMSVELCTNPDWCNDGSLTLASEGGFARNYSK